MRNLFRHGADSDPPLTAAAVGANAGSTVRSRFHGGPIQWLVLGGALLIAAIAISTTVMVGSFRERALLKAYPGSVRAEPKIATDGGILASISKPSTNSARMRKIRQVSLLVKSSMTYCSSIPFRFICLLKTSLTLKNHSSI